VRGTARAAIGAVAAISGFLVLIPQTWAKTKAKPTTSTVYRVHAANGTINVNFASDPATCAALGRCAITGTEVYTLGGSSVASFGELTRKGSDFGGGLFLSGGTTTTSVAFPGGGPPCTDQVGDLPLVIDLGRASATSVAADLSLPDPSPSGGVSIDIFDTHCPAPRVDDLVPANLNLLVKQADPLLLGVIPVSRFADKTVHITLSATHPIASAGFTGTATTSIQVTLDHVKLTAAEKKMLNAVG
jgi:hypothetical protein